MSRMSRMSRMSVSFGTSPETCSYFVFGVGSNRIKHMMGIVSFILNGVSTPSKSPAQHEQSFDAPRLDVREQVKGKR